MLDSISASYSAMAGAVLLLILPIVVAIGVGLFLVGLIQRKFGLVFVGAAFPISVGVIAPIMITSGASASVAPVLAAVSTFLPFTLLMGGGIFLFAVVPALWKASRSR